MNVFRTASRPLWVCSSCVRRVTSSRARHQLSALAGVSPDTRVRPVDHAPATKHDDALLRELFDAPARTSSLWSSATRAVGPNVGLFGNRYLTTPSGFRVLAARVLRKAQTIVARVLAATAVEERRAIVRDLDRLSDLLCRILDLSDFVRNTHPDVRFQRAAAEAWALVYQYMNQLNTMTGLCDQLVRALDDADVTAEWSAEERTVAEILRLDFMKSAVNLPKDARDRFVEVSQQVSELGSVFLTDMAPAKPEIVLPSSSLWGLYPSIAKSITKRGEVRLPTMSSDAVSALRSVHDEETRKHIYVATRTASSRTISLLETMLKLRAELAHLAGFESYAHLTFKDRMMAKTPTAVMEFLLALKQRNAPIVQKEFAELLQRKQTKLRSQDVALQAWDRDYYMEETREEMRSRLRHSDNLSSYFSVGTVMQGLSRLFSRLYGIRFVPRESLPGETWHQDVRRLDVMTDTGDQIAVLYCDLFYRDGKNPNPAHFTVRCARDILPKEIEEARADLQSGSDMPKFETAEQAANDGMETGFTDGILKQLPTIALVCDFPKHDWGATPALLSFHQVETLFHEMGHAIHSILARTSFQNVAGTRCATDFAELPSTLMEHFAADPTVLGLFARHWQTDEPLDVRMVADRTRVARRFEGFDTEHQILLAIVDQAYHAPDVAAQSFNSTAVYHAVHAKHAQGPHDPPETCWQGFFGHLHGYGSTYYSYLFDRVLAERVWRVVFDGGQDGRAVDRARGERLKEKLLRWGGSRDPWLCLSEALRDERLAKGDEKAMALVGGWGIKDRHLA
jgi:mitochondrial intermediate peptidase